ncbi:MAG: DUF6382 domain-containing protein [Clostridium sp.]|nr:DUF6382 domain-containing protein [Acetatifactor muris]MCM1527800.1 DUF6382 domain-containing protein [Bacteroides sp.]MCM1563895.1 DUF6382 domain-containing protein [Clostridium sp.]
MLETEFIRSLQSNYERVHLQQKPDEQRYQYCILTRGGIRGLLPCSLRYINGQAYLYYDITSRQNVAQLYGKQVIRRDWVIDFFRNYDQIRQELGRFLLDEKNVLVYPEQIFQDLSSRKFFFLYLPYHGEDNGMNRFLEFVLGHMDYEDEPLVECAYNMYEQYEKVGEVYLREKIFEDIRRLEDLEEKGDRRAEETTEDGAGQDSGAEENLSLREIPEISSVQEKKSFWKNFGMKRRKAENQSREERENRLASMEAAR